MEISQRLQKRGGVCRLLSKKVKLILLISTFVLLALSYLSTSCSESIIKTANDEPTEFTTTTISQVKTPQFSIESGTTFETSIIVDLSCATKGATIKYSFDNVTWITGKIVPISSTTTLYAKASMDGMRDSEVVSAIYISNAVATTTTTNQDVSTTLDMTVSTTTLGQTTTINITTITSTTAAPITTTTIVDETTTSTTDTYVSSTSTTFVSTSTTLSSTVTTTAPTTSTIKPTTTSTNEDVSTTLEASSTTTVESTTTTDTYVSTTLETTTTTTVSPTTTSTVDPTTSTIEPITTSTIAPTTSFEPTTSTTTIIDETTTTTTTYVSTTIVALTTTTANVSTTTTTIEPTTTTTTTGAPTTTTIITTTTTSTTVASTSTTTYASTTTSSTSTTTTTIADAIPPADPSITINPTTPTSGDVTVTITFSVDSAVKQYKIGTSSYQSYTAPFTVSENTIIYAKAQDAVGNWSGEVSYSITNIDKTAPTATVAYSTTAPTNSDVIAMITPSEWVTITNNDGLTTRTFIANGSFTFNFIDAAGNTGSVTATVSNIDKTSPTATVAYSTTALTNGDVIATITPSELVTITNNDGLMTRIFTENGSFTFEFTDSAGNTGSATAMVNNIDKTAPADPSIAINPTTPTSGDVTVTITFSGDSAVKQYKIGTSSYQSYAAPFTVSEDTTIYAKAQDAVGNWSGEVNYSVTNIDRGDFNVTITLVSPIEAVIDFGTYNGMLDKNIGQVLNVTATLDGATNWEWYLDNDIIGTASANCSVDSSNYDPGPYNLTVFAVKGGLTYSGTIKINIEN